MLTDRQRQSAIERRFVIFRGAFTLPPMYAWNPFSLHELTLLTIGWNQLGMADDLHVRAGPRVGVSDVGLYGFGAPHA